MRQFDVALLEQARDENAHLVGGALAQRGQPPAVGEPLAVEHADRHVRVADVYREQHASSILLAWSPDSRSRALGRARDDPEALAGSLRGARR